ncbi:MAG: hypothetical protein M9894_24460 [Planctomycetes bacterium]|nr:hypothetical protein [Planctomycetota bacterium]
MKSTWVALVLMLGLAGCEPDRSRFVVELQPDGSGSFRMARERGAAPADDDLRPAALRALADVGGVAAWTELQADRAGSGALLVEARGWFEALGDVRLPGGHALTATLVGDALEVRYHDPVPDRLAQLLLLDRARARATLTSSDDDFAAACDRMRGFLRLWLAAWRFEVELALPGPLEQVHGFRVLAPDRVALRQDVDVALDLLERDLLVVRAAREAVLQGELTPDEGLARVEASLVTARPTVARCVVRRLPPWPDPSFEAAFEEAIAAWQASTWRALLRAQRP